MSIYDDIIEVNYPFDLGHKRMSTYDRCSQFMPFSALTGYKEAVLETARITSDRIILDEEAKEILDNKISVIKEKLSLNPYVSITYFVSDKVKSGGSYKNLSGNVRKIDLYKNVIVIDDKKIFINDIVDIRGSLFDSYNGY